jgi:hypothetical protein
MTSIPNKDWYFSLSLQKNLSPRCPYANIDKCPHYYESISLFGDVGIATALQPSEEKRLLKKWKNSEYWPKVKEHEAAIWNNKDLHNFCPEVSFDVFGLFASQLHHYADEIDANAAYVQLSKDRVSVDDPRWQWSHVTPMHYSECRLYSQLLSTNAEVIEKTSAKEIVEINPGIYGISINIKEIIKRIWKWICSPC